MAMTGATPPPADLRICPMLTNPQPIAALHGMPPHACRNQYFTHQERCYTCNDLFTNASSDVECFPCLPLRLMDAKLGRHSHTARRRIAASRRKAPDKPKPSITASLQLIWRSSYLLHICAYLFANAVCSSMFYFVKTITMLHSDVDTSSRRTAWFAGVNSVSAGIMLVLQVRQISGRITSFIFIRIISSRTPAPLIGCMRLRFEKGCYYGKGECCTMWRNDNTEMYTVIARDILLSPSCHI